MKVIIIEDELLAQERLSNMLKVYDGNIEIIALLESIEEALKWFSTKAHPDLIFMDIHLSDGHSFEILKNTTIAKPIIFTTAYDEYALEAFKHYSIDYILKPITEEALANAINKYKNFVVNITPKEYDVLLTQTAENISNTYKERFLAKIGQRLFFIDKEDVLFFSAENKNIFITDKNNKKFIINTTIEKLETQLHPKEFFRINRKTIIKAASIEQVKPYFNNRLIVQLKGIQTSEDLVISRERVSEFKAWAEN